MNIRFAISTVIFSIVSGSPLIAQTVVTGYSPERHERFNDDRGDEVFFGAGYDLSGVGRTDDGIFATHIGEGWFLTSASARVHSGQMVTFVGEEVSAIAVDYGFRVGRTDLWLGKLTSEPGSDITSYSIERSLSSGESVVAVGAVLPSDTQSFVVGTNEASAVGEVDTTSFYQAPTFATSTDEIGLDLTIRGNGESGAPTFVDNGGVLSLAGLHWKEGTDNLLGGHIERIATLQGFDAPLVISGHEVSESALPVPEPGSALLVGLGLALGVIRRRR